MITTPLVTRPTFAAQPDSLSRISNNGYRSLPYNILLCLFSSVKLLFNVVVLLKDQNTLPGLQLWLTLSTISDVIGTVLLIIETVVLLYYRPVGNRDPEADEENAMDYHEIRELNKSKVYITATILNNCYYFFLWVWGHHIYFKSCSGCYQSQQTIAFLVFIYLYFGYFYIGCSILMAILNYSCFSFFTFSQTRLASRAKKWSPLQGLITKQYSADTVSTVECYICLVNYNEGDQLVELPCNSKHNFHEVCIKKWLKINNVCPLCRKPLSRLSEGSTMNEIELPTMIV